jgi:RNA polymerase sigma factor (TIGR02999 family)
MVEITQLLQQARAGDASAGQSLYALVYDRLHAMARGQQRGAQRVAQTTSLVHEAYLRMALPGNLALVDRTHFFAVAATAMRQIVIDRARAASAQKRGSGRAAVTLDEGLNAAQNDDPVALLQVDAAIERLRSIDPRLATLVELKVFGGLEVDELSEALGVSDRSVKRYWRQARALLMTELE